MSITDHVHAQKVFSRTASLEEVVVLKFGLIHVLLLKKEDQTTKITLTPMTEVSGQSQ